MSYFIDWAKILMPVCSYNWHVLTTKPTAVPLPIPVAQISSGKTIVINGNY